MGNVGTGLCLTSVDMTKPVRLLASLVSLFLAGPVVARDSLFSEQRWQPRNVARDATRLVYWRLKTFRAA